MQCNVALSQEKAISEQLKGQLNEAVALIAAEKKAREELTALLMSVKDAAEKVSSTFLSLIMLLIHYKIVNTSMCELI